MNEKIIDDGGDAFPNTESDHYTGSCGMSLRDYLAAKAMPIAMKENSPYQTFSQRAYEIADAMIEARKAVK